MGVQADLTAQAFCEDSQVEEVFVWQAATYQGEESILNIFEAVGKEIKGVGPIIPDQFPIPLG